MTTTLRFLTIGAAWALPALASAQTQPVQVGGFTWRPVESGLADVGPVGISQRAMPVDLRVGANFDRVYEIDGRPRLFGGTPAPTYYMRMNAGVVAVFPRSSYTSVGNGIAIADIPAGTVYSIGGNLSELVGQPTKADPKRPSSNYVNRSAEKRPSPDPASQPAPKADPVNPKPTDDAKAHQPADKQKAPAPPATRATAPSGLMRSLWFDEEYRKQRVAALLDEAAKVKK
jgi:hypothetical protein